MATEYYGWKTRTKGAGGKWGKMHDGYASYSSAKAAAEKAVAGSDTQEYEVVALGNRPPQRVIDRWFN